MTGTDHDRGPWDDDPGGLGRVLDEDRGRLVFELLHGEALVACASWALGESGVELLDPTLPWESVVHLCAERGEPLVLHDALCPMTPPAFIAECVQASVAQDAVVVGTRPVTDTVKRVEGDLLGDGVDRASLLAVASPLVVPARVVATLTEPPALDLAVAVAALAAAGHPVVGVETPPEGRRVSSPAEVRVLEALSAAVAPPGPRLRGR